MKHRINVTVRKRPESPNYYLAAISPLNGKELRRSAKTTRMKDAIKAAAEWEAELEQGIVVRNLTWEQLTSRFTDEYLPRLRVNSQSAYRTTISSFTSHVSAKARVTSITGSEISKWSAALRKSHLSDATQSRHLRHLKAILNWAVSVEIIPRCPQITMPSTAGKKRFAKGRAITEEEFSRMKDAARTLSPSFVPLLDLLWLSGLRISEAVQLSFDSPPIMVDLSGAFGRTIFRGDGQKSGHDETVPMPPDLRDFIASLPRSGQVVRPTLKNRSVNLDTVKRQIGRIGQTANVVVNESTGKHATAHDLRRSFGCRWALRVHPLVLQRLMRHETLQTTLAYYVDLDESQTAEALYSQLYRIDSAPIPNPNSQQRRSRKK